MSIEEKFFAAVAVIKNLPKNGTFQPSDDLALKLYAYYMQATEGPCNTPKPSIWNAWNDLGNMPKEVAMNKYIEELSKVIETMSYNETVSQFMSLIGPFYEFVSSEDGELIEKRNPTEYPFPLKLEDVVIPKSVSPPFGMEEKEVRSPLENGNKNTSSTESSTSPEQRVINHLRFTRGSRHCSSLSCSDMLVLIIINLHTSMEDIVKKFDKLMDLAKSTKLRNEEAHFQVDRNAWDLNVAETALAILWPIALHLYVDGLT